MAPVAPAAVFDDIEDYGEASEKANMAFDTSGGGGDREEGGSSVGVGGGGRGRGGSGDGTGGWGSHRRRQWR